MVHPHLDVAIGIVCEEVKLLVAENFTANFAQAPSYVPDASPL